MFNAVDLTEMKDKGYTFAGQGPTCGSKSSGTTGPQIGLIKVDSLGGGQQTCMLSPNISLATKTITATTLTCTITSIAIESLPHITVNSAAVLTNLGCVASIGSIAKLDNNNTPTIYPNPANTILNIDFKNIDETVEITIVDVLGRTHINKKNQVNLTSIDLTNFPDGIYFIHIKGQNTNSTQKILVQH